MDNQKPSWAKPSADLGAPRKMPVDTMTKFCRAENISNVKEKLCITPCDCLFYQFKNDLYKYSFEALHFLLLQLKTWSFVYSICIAFICIAI